MGGRSIVGLYGRWQCGANESETIEIFPTLLLLQKLESRETGLSSQTLPDKRKSTSSLAEIPGLDITAVCTQLDSSGRFAREKRVIWTSS